MDNKEICAKRLREGLDVRGMNQAELCERTGIPKSAMSQYCNARLKPRQDRIYLIASVLDVSEAWLMGFDVPMERMTPAPENEDGQIKEFSELFGKLSASEQTLIISQIKGILSDR